MISGHLQKIDISGQIPGLCTLMHLVHGRCSSVITQMFAKYNNLLICKYMYMELVQWL